MLLPLVSVTIPRIAPVAESCATAAEIASITAAKKTNRRVEDIPIVPAIQNVLGGTTDAREPDARRASGEEVPAGVSGRHAGRLLREMKPNSVYHCREKPSVIEKVFFGSLPVVGISMNCPPLATRDLLLGTGISLVVSSTFLGLHDSDLQRRASGDSRFVLRG
jgi:hypothetical protein